MGVRDWIGGDCRINRDGLGRRFEHDASGVCGWIDGFSGFNRVELRSRFEHDRWRVCDLNRGRTKGPWFQVLPGLGRRGRREVRHRQRRLIGRGWTGLHGRCPPVPGPNSLHERIEALVDGPCTERGWTLVVRRRWLGLALFAFPIGGHPDGPQLVGHGAPPPWSRAMAARQSAKLHGHTRADSRKRMMPATLVNVAAGAMTYFCVT